MADPVPAPAVQHVVEQVQLCKESNEVFKCLAGLVEDIKAKKDISSIAAENLPALLQAVQGFEMLDNELQDAQFDETAGLGLGRISKALRAKPAVPQA